MAGVTREQLLAANLETGFGSGEGLAIRSIMLDTIQRYYAASPQGTEAEKMAVVNKLVLDAARAHKDGISVAFMSLTLTSEQKELAGLGWQKLLGGKDPKNVIAFLEDSALKAVVNRLPFVSKETADALTERGRKEGVKERDLQEIQDRKDAGFTSLQSIGALISLPAGTFENVAARHQIMYYKDAQGKKWELDNSFEAAIEAVKKDLAMSTKTSALDSGLKLAVADTRPDGSAPLSQLAAERLRTTHIG